MPIIPVLRRLRQEDHEFEANLDNIFSINKKPNKQKNVSLRQRRPDEDMGQTD